MRYDYDLNKASKVNVALDTSGGSEAHIYDQAVFEARLALYDLCETNEFLMKVFKQVIILLHPFEIVTSAVTSRFIPDCVPIKITNAFMKMWETLDYLSVNTTILTSAPTLTMFDVAGAPGMFIIAVDVYLRTHFPKIELDWQTCSLEGGTALIDNYKLFANNLDRYHPCDVTKEGDIRRCIDGRRGKFALVTGDIGIPHESDGRTLQECNQLDIEWGQMITALNLVEKGGVMFLKMYSFATYESLYLLDLLTLHFDKVKIIKPYTSRITNAESYILALGRNNLSCESVSLTRPRIMTPYKSLNEDICRQFELERTKKRDEMVQVAMKIIGRYRKAMIKLANQHYPEYEEYFNELKPILTAMYQVSEVHDKDTGNNSE